MSGKRKCQVNCEVNKEGLLRSEKGASSKEGVEVRPHYCQYCGTKWNLEIRKNNGRRWRKVA